MVTEKDLGVEPLLLHIEKGQCPNHQELASRETQDTLEGLRFSDGLGNAGTYYKQGNIHS